MENYKDIETKYIGALRALLGVREATPAHIILLETGMPTLKDLVKKRTSTFVKKNIRTNNDDTPLVKSYNTCQEKGTKGYRYIKGLLDDPDSHSLEKLKDQFMSTPGTRAATYRSINPELVVHPVYTSAEYIEEKKRVTFTRLRVSSHRLKVETGRWSRTPRENRLCNCAMNTVQDENHVLLDCEKTSTIRMKYAINKEQYTSISDLMKNCEHMKLVNFVEECMNEF